MREERNYENIQKILKKEDERLMDVSTGLSTLSQYLELVE